MSSGFYKLRKNKRLFFRDNGMTFLDDALSLPGLTLDLLDKLKDPNSFFILFNQTHADLHTLLKKQIVGGPSIVWKR